MAFTELSSVCNLVGDTKPNVVFTLVNKGNATLDIASCLITCIFLNYMHTKHTEVKKKK